MFCTLSFNRQNRKIPSFQILGVKRINCKAIYFITHLFKTNSLQLLHEECVLNMSVLLPGFEKISGSGTDEKFDEQTGCFMK